MNLVKERETLGEFLKREREMKKISLRELAKNTRVRERFLKAIEEDRYELLPSSIYIKGFLSAYARYVRLDPHEVLLRYERSLRGEESVPSESKSEKKPPKRAKWNQKQTVMISGVIAISLLISYFLHPYLSGPSMERPLNKPKAQEVLPVVPIDNNFPEPSPVVEKEPFSLKLKAIEETWVQIQVDGQPQAEVLFKPGEGGSYQATNRIKLMIGNAGGLDLVFNGSMLEKFGKSGEVVTLVFTPQGVERKRPEERKAP